MSNLNNEMLLERFFEEGLEMGLSDKSCSEEFANKKFEENCKMIRENLINGIVLEHIATGIPEVIALNSKEMQLALDNLSQRSMRVGS